MLRFRLANIPIEVHVSHLAFSAVVALLFAPRLGWGATAPTGALIGIWMFVLSASVLVHELGHALAARAFGYRPVIRLVGITGRTVPNPNETIPWYRDVLMTLSGPAAGLLLGFVASAAWLAVRGRGVPGLEYGLLCFFAANLFWAVVNLLPLQPLDGGRIATSLFIRVFGREGFLYAQVMGLFVGGLIALLALVTKQPFGIFAVVYMVQTGVMIALYRRGELPIVETHPLEAAAARAEALLASEAYEQARSAAVALLEQELQPSLRGRVHLLLGWVALKLGEGRQALDHFSQAEGFTVPPQALAAGFSLIGDDARAVPLWEQAARATNDPTLLHEWAGALIRQGRVAEAFSMSGLHEPAAFQAAQRVAVARGDWAAAARVAESAFERTPTAERAYEAACCWAKANEGDDAVRMLVAAAQHGLSDGEKVARDAELSSLRAHAGFNAFLSGLRAGPRN